jgi:two-component system cell cycle sensor histidine kinase/response regulator CckA
VSGRSSGKVGPGKRVTWLEFLGGIAALLQLAAAIYVLRLSRLIGARRIGWILFTAFVISFLLRVHLVISLPSRTEDPFSAGTEIVMALFISGLWLFGFFYTEELYVTRQAAEKTLATERNWLHVLIQNLPDSIYVKDKVGRYLLHNPADAQLVGAQTTTESLGKTVFDLVAEEVAQQYHADDQKIIQLGRPLINHEEPFVGRTGREGWLLTTKVPLRDTDGNVTGLVGISRDITERKNTEAELRKALSLLNATLDATADGILVVNRERKVMGFNRRFIKMWRIPQEMAEARDGVAMLNCVLDQVVEPDLFLQKIQQLYDQPEAESYDEVRFKDGRFFERFSNPHRVDGEIVGRVWSFRDVSERRRTEAELRKALSLHNATLDATADGILVVDREGKVLSCNRRFEKMWRIPETLLASRDDAVLLNHVLDQLIEPDAFLEKVRQLYEQPEIEGYDELRFKDGRVFERFSHPHRVDGRTVGRVWSFSDVTERRHAENALLTSERRFRSIWESSVDGMRLTDAQGTIISVNEAYCRMVGMRESELAGSCYTLCYSPEEDPVEMLEKYRQRFAGRTLPSHFERRMTFRSGKSVDLDITNSFIEMGGGEALLLCIFRDTTERNRVVAALRESEERFRNLAENIEDVVWIADRQLRKVLYVNPAYERVWGCTCRTLRDDIESIVAVVHTDDRARIQSRMDELRQGIFRPEEYRIVLADGTERWIRDRVFGIKDEEDTIYRIAGIAEDITVRKRAEEERLGLERKLMDAQKLESLGILAGGIAHDFNNLLTAILGNASLARIGIPESSPLQPYLKRIEKTSVQAAELCKQMLAYSGRGKFTVRRIALNDMIREMNHLLEISINKKNVLRFEFADNLPPVSADPAQLQQVILNLVINAAEAIGDRSGVIRVCTGVTRADRDYLSRTHLAPELPEGDYVHLEVEDTGCGMDAPTQARIFDPFFSTKFTGRGLGLAAVLGIARGHQGALKVVSQPGHGSTFRFLLPPAPGPVEPAPAENRTDVRWRGDGTVLVVDDEEAVRMITARILEAFGFDVLVAADGREGVESFRRHASKIVAVVLDMTMPHLNGEEAFREIQKIRKDTPVLLISGYSEQDATRHFTAKGLAGFLQKPFKPHDLLDKLRAILESGKSFHLQLPASEEL